MYALYFFVGVTFYVLFGMKYWTLSLKIDSLVVREEQLSKKQVIIVNTLFWSVVGISAASAAIFVIIAYRDTLIFYSGYSSNMSYFGLIGFLTVGLVSVALVIDAYRRLNKCLEHDKLSIQRR